MGIPRKGELKFHFQRLGRCPSIHGRWRCSEPPVGPHVHALRNSEGRPIAVWLDDGRALLTPEERADALPSEAEALAEAAEGDRMLHLALLDNAFSIAQCTIDALADGGGDAAREAALGAVGLLHSLSQMAGAVRWVPVTERLPPADLPVFLWGDRLEVGVDHPLPGRLCGCHGEYVLDLADCAEAEGKEVDHAEYVRRMLGTVTHWLDWRPGP